MRILVAYDGTVHAKKALTYGMRKLKEGEGGALTLLQVFDRRLFVDYDAGPRAEEMARAEAAYSLDEAKRLVREQGAGLAVRMVSEEGDAVETILRYAGSDATGLLLAPPRYKALLKNAPCPVMIIPGTILVPVDNTGSARASLDRIEQEVAATGSQVLLLGIIPVHLYSREEKKELENVRKETAAAVKGMKKMLREKEIAVSDLVRSGYPDEEILRAAEEQSVSLIMLPTGGATPSELSKAAVVLLDEPQRLRWPVFLLPAEGAA